MSDADKIDPALGWMFVEQLLAEDEAEGLEKLSDAEVNAELRRAGFDPACLPGADEIFARGAARAAERQRATEVRKAARFAALARRRRQRSALTLAAAMFTLFIVVMVKQGPAIVAEFRRDTHGTIGPDHEWVPPMPPPATPRERAEALRDEAVGSCAETYWAQCRNKLDEAKKLDPEGESEEEVQRLRKVIREKLNPDESHMKQWK